MSLLQRLWLRIGPTMESIELGSPAGGGSRKGPAASAERTIREEPRPATAAGVKLQGQAQASKNRRGSGSEWPVAAKWLFDDIPYIAMLLLALAGVVLRLPVTYWIILTPIFGLISIIEGWSHFSTPNERMGLASRVAAIWCALLLAIYLLYNSSAQGVMNANGTSLAMITLLALGTFVAGVQARVWQICAVGAILFLAVPGVGWLQVSPLLLTAATCVVIAVAGLVWWLKQFQSGPAIESEPSTTIRADVSPPE